MKAARRSAQSTIFLLSDDGKISDAVISVGGFLGIGSKLVSIPFGQIKFEESQQGRAVMTPTPGAVAPVPGAVGAAATSPGATPTTVTIAERPTTYSLVLPGSSKESLTKAADFHY